MNKVNDKLECRIGKWSGLNVKLTWCEADDGDINLTPKIFLSWGAFIFKKTTNVATKIDFKERVLMYIVH